jgi:hypothetical protein
LRESDADPASGTFLQKFAQCLSRDRTVDAEPEESTGLGCDEHCSFKVAYAPGSVSALADARKSQAILDRKIHTPVFAT